MINRPHNQVSYEGVYYGVQRAFGQVAAGQTDAELIAAVPGHKIVVTQVRLICAGDTPTELTFNQKGPSGSGSAVSMPYSLGAHGGVAQGYSGLSEFEAIVGYSVTCDTGAGDSISWELWYIAVPAPAEAVAPSMAEGASSLSAAGSAPVTGSAAQTQAAQTVSGAGTAPITGDLGKTQGADTVVADATGNTQGVVDIDQGAQQIDAAGQQEPL